MKKAAKRRGASLTIILIIINIVLFIWIAAAYICRDKEDAPSPSAAAAVQTDNGASGADKEASSAGRSDSKSEAKTNSEKADGNISRPDLKDFLSQYPAAALNGRPKDSERITELTGIEGNWKAFILYEPKDPSKREIRLFSSNLKVVNGKLFLTADWYERQTLSHSKSFSEEDKADTVFTGSIENDMLVFKSEDSDDILAFKNFWRKDGKDYAIGRIKNSSGVSVTTAMVRP
ncbi:hypothetical protein IJT93_08790 [bacterium]|nr:hypothetical protein [bacterium]